MLRTQIVQPLYHSNQRSEFRVSSKGKVLLPNLRLCNFGVTNIVGGVVPGPATIGKTNDFGFAAGCMSLIRNIVLYSGNVILDQIQDADRWLGVSNMISNYNESYDINQKLICTNLNVLSVDDGDLRHSLDFQPLVDKQIGRINLQKIFPFLTAQITGANGQLMYDDKGDVMQLEYLTDFDDLRLVIEYNTDVTHIFSAWDSGTGRPTSWTVNQPELVFEEVVDESLAADIIKQGPVRFVVRSIERERLDIAAAGSTRLRGFDGKQLTNLIFQVLPGGTVDPQLCYSYSTLQPGEKMQVVVNGRKLLPFQGADTAARKSALFADSVGEFIAFTGSTDIRQGARSAVYAPVYQARPRLMLGDLSFMGVSILDTVSQLELEYSNSLANFAALQVWAWGEVLKYVSKDKATGAIQTGYITN